MSTKWSGRCSTIFRVEDLQVLDEPSVQPDFVVCHIPPCCCGQLGTWEPRQPMKVQSLDSDAETCNEQEANGSPQTEMGYKLLSESRHGGS